MPSTPGERSEAAANQETLSALVGICGERYAREAGPADAVAGVPARWIVVPGSAAELAGVVAHAAATGLAVTARGAGSKLDWGGPPARLDVLVDTGRLAGLHGYAAGDPVATVGAGTELGAAQELLAAAGQRIALDPGSGPATIGGVLATGEAGPLRLRHGPPRDLVTTVEFVRADGVVVRSGGPVTEALGGLLCGSYGSLGLITSATLRLQPSPAAQTWVLCPARTPIEVRDLAGRVLAGPLLPAAIEMDLPATDGGTVGVLIEGSPEGVAARARAVVTLLGAEATAVREAPAWWGRYPFRPGDVALKLVAPIDTLHAGVYVLRDGAGTPVPVRGSAGVGVAYAALPGDLPVERVDAVLTAVRVALRVRGGFCSVLAAPPAIRAGVDPWGVVPGRPLMRRVKDQLDPAGTLTPGRGVPPG
jgi:glycolate oxidase FAD binding subunit